jgi:hypothetical protein
MRSKSTGLAYFLWFVGGLWGVHNFYLGKWIWGLVYLALNFFSLGAMIHSRALLGNFSATDSALFSAFTSDPSLRAAALAMSVLNVLLDWDLFTLWWQVRRSSEVL